ncbi:PQQ-binding-like beta-propeller repeat protein [Streptomyces sp. NPDC021224]|uniref:outer membrane protein assembly factor BamB family protein n=1 Tax=unclassified Streptomyces TaxID=2593676 RepID=UPI00379A6275
MSQPPPPPGTPPEFGKSDAPVPPPPGSPQTPPPPPGGYGYPAPGSAPPPPPPPAPGGGYGYPAPASPQTPPPAGPNPYAQPVPPGQNPYAQAPTQAAFQVPPQTPPPGVPPQAPPPYPGAQQPYPGQPQYGQTPPPGPYGYQTPAPYPGAPGGPGGARNNNKMIAIIAAVVAVALIAVVAVYFATKSDGGDDPKPKPTASGQKGPTESPHSSEIQFAWDKPADTVAKKDNLKRIPGIWFTDKLVVKQEINKVTAYDIATGDQAWTLAAPAGDDCSSAKDTYQNFAAIQYGPTCNQIMVFDLTTGVAKWSATLPGGDGGSGDFDYSQMAISGDTVGVDWMEGSIAYRISTQKVLWQGGNGNCEDDGYAGGAQFVVVVNCDFKTYKVQVVDPENSGKAKWSWQAPSGFEVKAVVSTDPVVVVLDTQNGDALATDVVTLSAGKMLSRISLGTDKYDISLGDNGVEDVHNILVSKDTVYLTLRSQGDSKGQVLSGIVAFNTADGKQKWIAKPADKQAVVGLDFLPDGKILAVEPPDYDVAGQLDTVDPATGAMQKYAVFADGTEDKVGDMSDLEGYMYWHNGHFFYSCHTVYESNDDQKYIVDLH